MRPPALALLAYLIMNTVPAPAMAQGADAGAQPSMVVCASKSGERQSCPADTRKGVDLIRSIGQGGCELGKSWGYDEKAIWVAEGCSAEFALGARAQPEKKRIGDYVPRAGYTLVDAEQGQVRFKPLTYVRYLNQRALDDTFTDSFGQTSDIDKRQDFQLNKVSLQFLAGR